MSKNAMSFYLRQLIVDSGAVSTSRPPRAHDIRGIATSLNYYSNLSLSNLMQVATWKSNRVFASRYLKEVSATQDNIRQFGPLVIAGDRLHHRPPQHKHSPHPSPSSNVYLPFFLTDSSPLFLRAIVHIERFILPCPDIISIGGNYYLGPCSHIVQTYSLISPCSH